MKSAEKLQGKKAGLSWKVKDWIAAYIFIAPVTIGLMVFYIWPFIQNFWFSFNDVNKFNVTHFIGLDNYRQMLSDKEVFQSFGNTLKYVVVTVPVGLFLSLVIAALLNAKIKGKSIYRTLYFLPSVTMAAAVAMVWKWVFNEKMGILNAVITSFGGPRIGWLTNSKTAIFVVMLVGLWMTVGYNMIILLAGMQGISKTYYEAAAIDGCPPGKCFWQIMLPMAQPGIITVSIFNFINVWNEYFISLIFGNSDQVRSVAVGLYSMINSMKYTGDWAGMFASVIIVFLPTFVLYLFLSERIIAGVTGGGVKG